MHINASMNLVDVIKNLNVSRDSVSVVHKFGRIITSSTSFLPVSIGGIYRTPQVSGATKLRVKAGNAADTAAGAGAREVTIEGIDVNGDLATETLATAGASASANSVNDYLRLYRFYVSSSGTYATQSAGSHVGDIVIENSAGTEDWGTIDATGFARGQSEIAAYTVPSGKSAYLINVDASEATTKVLDIIFTQRQNILETAAPYSAMRESFSLSSQRGVVPKSFDPYNGPFPAGTDLGILAKVNSGTPEVHANFSLLIVPE